MFTSSLIVFSAVLALAAGSPQYPAPPPSYAPVEEPHPTHTNTPSKTQSPETTSPHKRTLMERSSRGHT
ncbi:Putative LOC100870303, partial [Caligus rogercresseyi]